MTSCLLCRCGITISVWVAAKINPLVFGCAETAEAFPQTTRSDITTLKDEVQQLQECTDTVNGLSSKLEGCIGGLKDQLTPLSKQINTKHKPLTDCVETLKTTTNKVKTVFDQVANQIINKTNTIIKKVKSQTESIQNTLNKSSPLLETKIT